MKKKLPILFCCILTLGHLCIFAQDSSHLRISLITCGPGGPNDELYTTFGHTGVRITDSSTAYDLVYNYGTFDAFEDNFYLNFVKGRLSYYVAASDFKDFAEEYQATNRSITEQVLNLSSQEKIAIQKFLNHNIQLANRHYRYDFCYDNCTTRVRDIFEKIHDSSFAKKPVMPAGTTFRNAIHLCLNRNDQNWSKLGIDLLLGTPCDAVMTPDQMDFLPENLEQSFNKTDRPFVLSQSNLFTASRGDYSKALFTPAMVFSIMLIIIAVAWFSKNRSVKSFLQGFDGLLFFFTGFIGAFLIFMWFGTDHAMTKNNYNLLWALPTNLVLAFFVNSKKPAAKKGFGITGIILALVAFSWFFLPQQMNPAFLPLLFLLLYRSLAKYYA